MRVLKFGGTSVANAERFLRVADILESNARGKEDLYMLEKFWPKPIARLIDRLYSTNEKSAKA